jgi:hypothetical protein
MQLADFGGDAEPRLQSVQSVEPSFDENLPPTQSTHELEPVIACDVP